MLFIISESSMLEKNVFREIREFTALAQLTTIKLLCCLSKSKISAFVSLSIKYLHKDSTIFVSLCLTKNISKMEAQRQRFHVVLDAVKEVSFSLPFSVVSSHPSLHSPLFAKVAY